MTIAPSSDQNPKPFATPSGPKERIRMAAAMASDTIAIRSTAFRAMTGADPVILVATADSPLGVEFIRGKLGPRVPEALCGPAVLSFTRAEFLSCFSSEADRAGVQKELDALDAKPGDTPLVFAVNLALEFRIVRAAVVAAAMADESSGQPPADPAGPSA